MSLIANSVIALAVLSYALSCWQQSSGRRLDRRVQLLALILHALALLSTSYDAAANWWLLHFWSLASAFIWLILLACWLLRQHARTLQLVLNAAALLSLLVLYSAPPWLLLTQHSASIIVHIACSLLSVGVAVLALVLGWLNNYQVRSMKNSAATPGWLPPIMVFEKLIFIFIWQGFTLLALSMLSGYFVAWQQQSLDFIDAKILLSLAAWVTLSILLWQHYHSGWRGYKISWIMSTTVLFMFLILATLRLFD